MGYVHNTATFAEALWPGLITGWGMEYKEYEPKYTQFYQVQKSDKAFEKEQQFVGFPSASIKEEGAETVFSQMLQGYQKEYRHYTYSIGAVVTREMADDDQYRIISRIPKFLARSMRDVEEAVAHRPLNFGFDSTVTGPDGQALFSTSHTLAGSGGTLANTPSTAADLTMTALETYYQNIMDWTDDQGLKMKVVPKKLLVTTQNAVLARKILETEQAVGSADNDKNIVNTLGLQLIVSPYLTDTDAFFLLTDATDSGFTFFERRAAELARDNDFGTDNLKIKTSKRFSADYTDWRCAYGSPGA